MLAKAFKNCHDWAPFLLRLIVGAVFIYHGYPKIMDIGSTAGFLNTLQFPAPEFLAVVLAVVEFVGGILLVLGFLTRYVGVLLVVNMLVAVFVVHFANGFSLPNGYEYALTLLVASAVLVILGPGKFSLEKAVLQKEL